VAVRWSVNGYRRPPVNDISRHKSRLRAKQRDLRHLLNDWDPIGVADIAPSDEYDCFLGLIGQLYRGSSESQLAG
jgi:hypothetical protein